MVVSTVGPLCNLVSSTIFLRRGKRDQFEYGAQSDEGLCYRTRRKVDERLEFVDESQCNTIVAESAPAIPARCQAAFLSNRILISLHLMP